MADSVKPDVERVNDDDNSDNQPAGEAASPHPEKTVPDPSHEEEEQLNKNEVRIKVVLLDGKDTTITCQRKVKAADVIERAHSDMDTGEKDFFSLFFFVNNHKVFLEPEKTVIHQIPRDKRDTQPWILHYGVKYYLPDPSQLKEDYSRYLYALQLCKDIRENRVLTDRETAARLTALMLQANLGDYDPETHKEGYTKDFDEFFLIPKENRPTDYETKLIELHSSKAGYTPAQAEGEFCDVARKLPRYGYHLFGVQDDHSTLYLVANGFHGVQIYRERELQYFFKWPHIIKISYKRRKFRVKYHPVNEEGQPDLDDVDQVKYYCSKPPAAKRIWKNAIEQHTFFRLSEPKPQSRVTALFRRGSSFRFSGRTLRQMKGDEARKQHDFQRSYSERVHKTSYESYAPGYIPSQESLRRQKGIRTGPQSAHKIVIEREDPTSQKWVELDAPPVDGNIDSSKLEQQRVQVNFSVKDGMPEDQFKAVLRRNGGSMEVLTSEDERAEPSYRLSEVDPTSQDILTSVSLRVDPEQGVKPDSHGDSSIVFDSTNLPSVKLNADTTTSTTVIEPSGKTVSTGAVVHSTAPPLAQDDSQETMEVELFMKQEGELLKEVLNASASEGKTEIED